MADPAVKTDRRYRYADYRQWPEEERWELIDGVAWNMSPPPGTRHQAILAELLGQIREAMRDGPCRYFPAPFDVLLPAGGEEDDDVDTVVQPDISVICDPARITERGCRDAPDFVIEILSPSTLSKDLSVKKERYERAGVRELWFVAPADLAVLVFVLDSDGAYPAAPVLCGPDGVIAPAALPRLRIDLEALFARALP